MKGWFINSFATGFSLPVKPSPLITNRQKQAKILRFTRKLHRIAGISLFLFFFVMAVTGGLLGWKKHSNLMPETQRGTTVDMKEWKPMNELGLLATSALLASTSTLSEIDRMDARPEKGVVKVLFKNQDQEVQLDAKTGTVLSVGRRHNDWIERLHDGSVVDDWLGIPNGLFKVTYNTVMGFALVLFTVTGFWLWYGPRRMRR